MIEVEEGDTCPACGVGILIYVIEGCTCHTGNPPCSSCVNSELECSSCGWVIDDGLEFFNEGEFCI